MDPRVFEAAAASGLPCTWLSQGIEAGPGAGGWGSTLGGPTTGLAAGSALGLTASYSMVARKLIPIVVGGLSLHEFPVTKHDLEFAPELSGRKGRRSPDGREETPYRVEARRFAGPRHSLPSNSVQRGDIVDAVFNPLRFGPPRLAGCVRVEESESTVLEEHRRGFAFDLEAPPSIRATMIGPSAQTRTPSSAPQQPSGALTRSTTRGNLKRPGRGEPPTRSPGCGCSRAHPHARRGVLVVQVIAKMIVMRNRTKVSGAHPRSVRVAGTALGFADGGCTR